MEKRLLDTENLVQAKQTAINELIQAKELLSLELKKSENDKITLKNALLQTESNIPQQIEAAKNPLQNELKTLRENLSNVQGTIKSKEKSVGELGRKHVALKGDLEKAMNQNKDLQQEITRRTAQLDELQKSVPTKIAAAQSSLENENASLKTVLAEKDALLKNQADQLRDAQGQYEDLTKQYAAIQQDSSGLSKSFED